MATKLRLIGERFGSLVVIGESDSSKCGHAKWTCQCDCGKEVVVYGIALTSGNTKSCGCLKRKLLTKHGGVGSRLYHI